jgi:hypothetical protein
MKNLSSLERSIYDMNRVRRAHLRRARQSRQDKVWAEIYRNVISHLRKLQPK